MTHPIWPAKTYHSIYILILMDFDFADDIALIVITAKPGTARSAIAAV